MSVFFGGLSGSQTPASSHKWDGPRHGRFTEMIDDDPDMEYEPDSGGSDPEDFDDEDDCPIAVEIEISKFIEAVILLSF